MVLANSSCWRGNDRHIWLQADTIVLNLQKWYDVIGSHLHVCMPHEEWHAACGLRIQAQQGSAEVHRTA